MNIDILIYVSDEPQIFTYSTANLNITAVQNCIMKLNTCTAASRPRISASDFMVYCKAAQLTAHAALSMVSIPSSL
jgi:hypothetical protein